MNLLFSIDKNCVDLLLTCLFSVDEKGGAGEYTAYILNSDLGPMEMSRIKRRAPESVECRFVTVDREIFADFPVTKRYPRQIYYRLAAARLLPRDVDRVLYLDVDTLVINPIEDLYDTEFEGNMFVGCTHTNKILGYVNRVRLNVEEDVPYINTGVMVMNLEMMREEVRLEDIQSYAWDNKGFLILPDQDILTALYGDRVKLVDAMKYNLGDRDIEIHNADPLNRNIDLNRVKMNAAIVHFYGRNKPWKEHYHGMLGTLYYELQTRIKRRNLLSGATKTDIEGFNMRAQKLVSLFHGATVEKRVPEAEFWIWYSLIMTDREYTKAELGKIWSLPARQLNAIIALLRGQGFIKYMPATGSRRRIVLTPEGRRYGESVVLPLAYAETQAFRRFDREEKEAFVRGLKKFVSLLEEKFSDNTPAEAARVIQAGAEAEIQPTADKAEKTEGGKRARRRSGKRRA